MDAHIRRALLLLPLCAAASPEVTRIGGHSYAFPSGVFEGGQVESGSVGSFLIDLAWPEMRPLSPGERAMWPPRDTVRVLARGAAPVDGAGVPEPVLMGRLPAELSVATAPSSGIAARASGHIQPPAPMSPGEAASGAVPGIGMVQVQVDQPTPADAIQYDVFVSEPVARVRKFIQCARQNSVPVPDCAQTFVGSNLILKLSYPRKLVGQWREIHARVLAFLPSHPIFIVNVCRESDKCGAPYTQPYSSNSTFLSPAQLSPLYGLPGGPSCQ